MQRSHTQCWGTWGARCRSPASSPSTLHVSWERTSPCTESHFQEPVWSCFLLAFYAKLSQASTQVWPVIVTSVRSPVGTGRDAWGFKDNQASAARPYLLKTNTMKTLYSTPPTLVACCPLYLDSPVYYWSRPSVFHCFFEYDIITWPDVGS